jgi:hypothetical protein
VRDTDGVERDVDPTRARRHRVGVLVDGSLVEGVDLRCLGPASGGGNLMRYPVELAPGTPGEEDRRSLTCEGPGDGAADRTTASIDHSGLVLQQHLSLLSFVLRTRRCA